MSLEDWPAAFEVSLKNKIIPRLEALSPRGVQEQVDREAAVLLAIREKPSGAHFLLTRRTHNVGTHKGQISFPGGSREPGDLSLKQTALREAGEELGIEPDKVFVAGAFHDYLAVTRHLVRPFVGFISAQTLFSPQISEVEYVLEVPFEFFRSSTPEVKKYFRLGKVRPVYFYYFQEEVIWGLTAKIIRDFLIFLDEEAI